MGSIDTLSMLRALLPESVALAGGHPSLLPDDLRRDEATFVERAVLKRRREFAQGRQCARQALKDLGIPPTAIPVGPNRGPVWPEGTVGSITHCDDFVGAAVGSRETLAGLGIDAEPKKALSPEIRAMVLTPRELERARPNDRMIEDWPTVTFCAKEAIHKCINPSTGITLDFLDVEISLGSTGGFRATLITSVPPLEASFRRLQGRFAVSQTHVVAVATLPR